MASLFQQTKSVEELRADAIKQHEKMVVRLGDELDGLLKLVSHQREGLQAEMMDGMGYKKLGADMGVLRKLKELSAMFGHLTDAKIRYDKSMKQLADTMTPDEERAAVKGYIQSLEKADRGRFLTELVRWHKQDYPLAQVPEPVSE